MVTGCIDSESVSIFEPTALDLVITYLANANCGQNNGSICTSVTGGTAPYTYQWNDPNTQTSSCAMSLYAGCYSLFITDATGCVSDSLVCINDIAGPSIAVDTAMDITCFGAANGMIDFNVTGGATPYDSIQWYNGAGTLLPAYSGLTISNSLTEGTYTIIVTDGAGCISNLTQTILEPNQIVSAITSTTNNDCFGQCIGKATVAVAGGTTPYSYLWNNGQDSATATGLCAGTYSVTISDNNNCQKIQTSNITQPLELVMTPSVTNITCYGNCDGSINTNVTGGTAPYFYTWSPNSSNNPSAYNLCAGNYFVTVTDMNGCTFVLGVNIPEPSPLQAIGSANNSICFGQSTQIWVSGSGGTVPYTVLWTGSASNLSGSGPHNVNPLVNTNYNFTIMDDNGCSANGVITISVYPPVILSLIIDSVSISIGDTVTLCANASGGNGLQYIFLWSNGYIDSTFTQSCLQVNPLITTSYTVIASDGCSLNDTAYVTVVVDSTVGIKSLPITIGANLTSHISIYPNPNNGSFTIKISELKDDYKIKVFNVLGEIVFKSQIANSKSQIKSNIEIPIGLNKSSGIYYVQIVSEKDVTTERVIIDK